MAQNSPEEAQPYKRSTYVGVRFSPTGLSEAMLKRPGASMTEVIREGLRLVAASPVQPGVDETQFYSDKRSKFVGVLLSPAELSAAMAKRPGVPRTDVIREGVRLVAAGASEAAVGLATG